MNVIKDKALKPYRINISSNGYAVEKKTKSKDKDGNSLFSNEGYFSTVEGCLNKIIKLKADNSKQSMTLKEYVDELKHQKGVITKMFSKFKLK